MDSLLASYASSDDEAEASPQHQHKHQHKHSQSEIRIGTRSSNPSQSSIPRPQSSSSSFSSPFSSLPQPKSSPDPSPVASSFDAIPNPKRVVQFRPPVIPSPASSSKLNDDDSDEDDDSDGKKHQAIKQNTSIKSLISSMPAPKNSSTLGAFPGSGRRATVETGGHSSNLGEFKAGNEVDAHYNTGGEEGKLDNVASNSSSFEAAKVQLGEGVSEQTDHSYPAYDNHGNYDGYSGYHYDNHYGQYDQSNWASDSAASYAPDTSAAAAYAPDTSAASAYAPYTSTASAYAPYTSAAAAYAPDTSAAAAAYVPEAMETVAKVSGKRGRDKIPTEIVEVNQDELMKNRPRQDQVKLTGIAFGPAYQAAPSAGKPTKLHKRKHQIGSLYFDMKQKELELAERRSKGMLTKAQTQGKYGW